MLTHTLHMDPLMPTDAQLQDHAALIRRMLEVSPYFAELGVRVMVAAHDVRSTIFDVTVTNFHFIDVDPSYFIDVRYNRQGEGKVFIAGYYKECGGFGDEGPSIEEVYFGTGVYSFHEVCVKIATGRYEEDLHIEFERDEPKSELNEDISDIVVDTGT